MVKLDTLQMYIRIVNVCVARYKDKEKQTYNQMKLFLITVNIKTYMRDCVFKLRSENESNIYLYLNQ